MYFLLFVVFFVWFTHQTGFVMQNYWVRCRYGPLTECLNIGWYFLLVKSVVADFRWFVSVFCWTVCQVHILLVGFALIHYMVSEWSSVDSSISYCMVICRVHHDVPRFICHDDFISHFSQRVFISIVPICTFL